MSTAHQPRVIGEGVCMGVWVEYGADMDQLQRARRALLRHEGSSPSFIHPTPATLRRDRSHTADSPTPSMAGSDAAESRPRCSRVAMRRTKNSGRVFPPELQPSSASRVEIDLVTRWPPSARTPRSRRYIPGGEGGKCWYEQTGGWAGRQAV
jgi:hypothetical protein